MNKCLQHLNLLHIQVSQYVASDSYGEGRLEWSVAGSGSVLRVQGRADPLSTPSRYTTTFTSLNSLNPCLF